MSQTNDPSTRSHSPSTVKLSHYRRLSSFEEDILRQPLNRIKLADAAASQIDEEMTENTLKALDVGEDTLKVAALGQNIRPRLPMVSSSYNVVSWDLLTVRGMGQHTSITYAQACWSLFHVFYLIRGYLSSSLWNHFLSLQKSWCLLRWRSQKKFLERGTHLLQLFLLLTFIIQSLKTKVLQPLLQVNDHPRIVLRHCMSREQVWSVPNSQWIMIKKHGQDSLLEGDHS